MDAHQLASPDAVPEKVLRIWRAVLRHYESGTHEPPTRKELVDLMLQAEPAKPASGSTLDRTRREHPKLLPDPWPPKRGELPPWMGRPELLADYMPQQEAELPHLRYVVDRSGALRFVAAYTASLLGYHWEDLLGLSAVVIFTPDWDAPRRQVVMEDLLANPDQPRRQSGFLLHRDGHRVPIEALLIWVSTLELIVVDGIIPAEEHLRLRTPGPLQRDPLEDVCLANWLAVRVAERLQQPQLL